MLLFVFSVIEKKTSSRNVKRPHPVELRSNDSKFKFHTYLCVIENEFIPTLNIEHNGYAWVAFNKWPKPLHQGLRNTLSNKVNLTKLETVFKLIDLV